MWKIQPNRMRKPNFDKFPFVAVPDASHECVIGWDNIAAELQRAIAKSRTEKPILVVECYPGVNEIAVLDELQTRLAPALTILAADAYHSPEKIDNFAASLFVGDGLIAGQTSDLSLVNFFNAEPLWRFRRTIDELKGGLVLIVGCGASLIAWGHILVYADLGRRELRLRFRRKETGNLGVDNKSCQEHLKSMRAAFLDWPVADRWKRPLINRWDYVLDTNNPSEPKLANAEDVRRGLQAAAGRPFRVVPPGENSSLSSDCLLEENSLLLGFGEVRFEVPAIDLFFHQPLALLGETVHARFGRVFPTCFGFLDTMGGIFEPLAHGDDWREERAGLHDRPCEMRRHWFSTTVTHDTQGGVNILNLIDGEEAIVESPNGAFEPFVVHFAETFIVPASVGHYTIRPHGTSAGTEIATIKAFVRTRNFTNRIP